MPEVSISFTDEELFELVDEFQDRVNHGGDEDDASILRKVRIAISKLPK